MNVSPTAAAVLEACEETGADHMATGAFAFNYYGIPRSTKDFDVVVDVRRGSIPEIVNHLVRAVRFSPQVQFDTPTWGRRHIGQSLLEPGFVIELFELFDDPFVMESFGRRVQLRSNQLQRTIWLPTAEDVVVQKLRWGRPKDLEDARDVVAVQGPETLDVPYIERWCAEHGTTTRWTNLLDSLPPL